MEIWVESSRANEDAWRAARNARVDQLPQLDEGQREVARKLRIPEQEYSRSIMATELTSETLLRRTQRFANVLHGKLREMEAAGQIQKVVFRDLHGRFDVDLQVNGSTVDLHIDEQLVDDYFDRGSVEADQRLDRILQRAVASVTA